MCPPGICWAFRGNTCTPHANIIKAQDKQSKAYANRQLHEISQLKSSNVAHAADAPKPAPVIVPVPTVLPTVDTRLAAEMKVQTSTDKTRVYTYANQARGRYCSWQHFMLLLTLQERKQN